MILFDDSFQGGELRKLVDFGESLGIPVKYVCLVDYSNSRGAMDMGLDAGAAAGLPALRPAGPARCDEMLEAELDALWVVGANPAEDGTAAGDRRQRRGFLVVQDMFLTETARQADVVLPAACAYEKNGTVTNVTGEVQRLKRAINTMGAKPDLEIMGFIAREMGVAAALGPLDARTPSSRRSAARCAATMLPMAAHRHRRRGADHAGQRPHPVGPEPARPGAFGSQRAVRVGHAGALF